MGRPVDVESQLNLLDSELKLDETQKKAISGLLSAQQATLREIRDKYRRTPEEMEAWKKIQEEMRDAVKAQDKAKISELKDRSQQLHEKRQAEMVPAREAMEKAEQALHDGIFQSLRPDQREKFETVWKTRMAPRSARTGPLRNPRALKAIVDRLSDLTPDQKRETDALFETFQKERTSQKNEAESEASTKEGRESRARGLADKARADRERQEKLFNDVLNVLTPEQRAKVEEQLKGRAGRGIRGRGRGAGQRGSEGAGGENDRPAEGG